MKKLIVVLVLVCLSVGSSIVLAAEINPNNFPSGAHYNLNIHGKKADFNCPAQEYDPYTGLPIYGNSVFVPEYGNGEIYMVSGKVGGKAGTITELQATDPCAFDRNGATVKLPPNRTGYRVYARTLAKPTGDPVISLFSSLYMVQDEFGNDLLYLGMVTEAGFTTPFMTFTRSKGQSKALPITDMFQWTGSVCYFTQPTDASFTPTNVCCTDSSYPLDGVYDDCQSAAATEPYCDDAYSYVPAYCVSYTEEWVFNLGDYVTSLLGTNNSGVKLLQIRFYPN
jgi:hypothetical protein